MTAFALDREAVTCSLCICKAFWVQLSSFIWLWLQQAIDLVTHDTTRLHITSCVVYGSASNFSSPVSATQLQVQPYFVLAFIKLSLVKWYLKPQTVLDWIIQHEIWNLADFDWNKWQTSWYFNHEWVVSSEFVLVKHQVRMTTRMVLLFYKVLK